MRKTSFAFSLFTQSAHVFGPWLVNSESAKNVMQPLNENNGNGIPLNIANKIYQPCFTTKLTGQGKGSGLSLSYDIIKAHGGEVRVESKEGEGSAFSVELPLN